jgi:hypothetical protein
VRLGFRERHHAIPRRNYLYLYKVILPTFPEVSSCFESITFVTDINCVTAVTAKHGRPLPFIILLALGRNVS